MNRGVRRSLLKRAYESVRKHPFQVPMDHPIVGQLKDELANAPSADGNKKSADQPSQVCRPARAFLTNNQMQGWLWKKSNHSWIPSAFIWRKRWFVLNDRCLYYFGQSDDVEPKGMKPNSIIKHTIDWFFKKHLSCVSNCICPERRAGRFERVVCRSETGQGSTGSTFWRRSEFDDSCLARIFNLSLSSSPSDNLLCVVCLLPVGRR